ncbi:nucleoporin protein Ndc1-Nup [Pestalotiopsis sp. NC0098]|nr:nucleoporin protein Ndc1-Nup [Pestalotiopsis sp. NC0098]
MATVVRRAPYKDFLQPCMQRRFASALLVLLALSYVESLTLSSWNSIIWSWFPIGIAGIRTAFIFGSVLLVVVLRIAHPHIGLRTSNSPFDTFRQNIFSLAAFETVLTYTISAFLFSQVYLSSVADKANLQWITYHSGDRARLNERTLFYTMTMIFIGVAAGLLHLFLDVDRVVLGTVKETDEKPKQEDAYEKLVSRAPHLLIRAASASSIVGVFSYVFLYAQFRQTAWSWAMSFYRPFYNLPKTNIPPAHAPWSIWMLGRTIWAGTLLFILWNLSNEAFTVNLAKPPVKNGQPITSESKDPNGSLLNGLKNKKARISSFAMWELALIARDFDVRRKAIFEDIDRKEGPMWSQVYQLCMGPIKELEKRIDDYGKPPAAPAPAPAAQPQARARVVEPPESANVWEPAPPPKNFRDSVGKFVADVAKTPGPKPSETLVPFAKKTAADVRDTLLSKQHQEQLSGQGILGMFHGLLLMLPPNYRWFFRQSHSRRIATAVLGTPFGDISLHVNSAFALSRLAVASLTEDNYGNVHRDVPTIIRTFTTVIKKLEIFQENFPAHWTDPNSVRQSTGVEEVIDAFKDALARIITAFETYSSDLKLTRTDLRLAKEAAQKPEPQQIEQQLQQEAQPEMQQVN